MFEGKWLLSKVADRFGAIALVILLSLQVPVARAIYVEDEVGQRVRTAQTLGALGESLFGDSTNRYDGSTSFSVVDIDIPGNNALPVRIGRTLKAGNDAPPRELFGNWEIDVPYIGGTFARTHGWKVGSTTAPSYARCSGGWRPVTLYYLHDSGEWPYWGGNQLNIPGRGKQSGLTGYNGPKATDGQTTNRGTRDFTQIRCLANIANPSSTTSYSGEGFLAITPDGTKYYLNWMTHRDVYTLVHKGSTSGNETLTRDEYRLYATRVEDRFGNWVNYNWTGNKLTSITSSDNRTITISYDSYNHITSAVANGRPWNYTVEQNVSGRLTNVQLPDNSTWTLNTPSLNLYYQTVLGGLSCYERAPFQDTTATYVFKHPSGATGEFTFSPKRHERTRITRTCLGTVDDPYEETAAPVYRDNMALTTKKLSGPDLPTKTWTISYSAVNTTPSSHYSNCVTCSSNTRTVRVTEPDNSSTLYTFGIRYYLDEGKLLNESVYAPGGTTPLKSTQYSYVLSPGSPSYTYGIGVLGSYPEDAFGETKQVPVTQTTITQSGDTYNKVVNSFDSYAREVSVTRSNSFGSSRTDITAYADNTNLWVLNQVGSSTNSDTGQVESSTTYDTLARPTNDYSFTLPKLSATYNTDGTINTVFDALTRTTKYEDWIRGVPRKITLPDGKIQQAAVDANGWISSVTDEWSAVTGYGYDSMGRTTGITYPTGDTVAWTSDGISYAVLTAAELGSPVGAWRQRRTQGRHQASTYYDARWQPRLMEDKDTTTGIAIYTRKAYDHDGRVTFESYPSSTSSATAGINSTYDALGRLTKRQTTDGIVLETRNYLSGNRVEIIDADNKSTTITYQAFDQPAYDKATRIESPENQTTVIDRDVFGKILTITQGGNWSGGYTSASRSFTYDIYQRPCRRIDPESGSTIWGYDAASQVTWELKGQSGSGCVSTQPSGATLFGYDARSRKTLDDFPGTSDDVSYVYDPGVNRTKVINATATWTYDYNKRNLLEREEVVIDGKTLVLDPTYNGLAQVSSLVTPGRTISYSPNAWGQPTKLGSYAISITYHPNGLTSTYSLGLPANNGLTYAQLLDNRQRPQVQETKNGASTVQRFVYGYSNAGDLTSIDDAVTNTDDLTATYDGLHRLANASGIWGSYGYGYDSLNNIRSRTHSSGPNSLTYAYNSSNRLTGISGSQSRTYSYNAQGEITGDGSKTFTLNSQGQIQSIAGIASYSYDGNGKRIKVVKGGTTEYALYNKAGQLVYTEKGSDQTDYLNLNGQTIVEIKKTGSTDTVTYLHPDLLGSPRMATNASKSVSWQEHYDPYGQKLNGTTGERIGYTGHVFDPETSYVYAQARFYDPLVGRFLSTDPVHFVDDNPFSFNRYSYANNNSYRFTDPTGMLSCANSDCSKANISSQIPKAVPVDSSLPGNPNTPVVTVTFINDTPGGPSTDRPISTATAQMVETSLKDSGVSSANINSTTGGDHAPTSLHGSGRAVDINRVNGERVSPSNAGAAAVQNAAANTGNIRENFGPAAMQKTTVPGGTPQPVMNPKLTEDHRNHLHISGQK